MVRKIVALVSTLVAGSAGAAMVQPGRPFPAWNLVDHTGTPVSSAELAGKTYLLWYYPKALSSG